MNDKEKDFVKKINMDKAKNKTLICIFFTLLSLRSYVEPLIHGNFDFGMIFETLTLVFIFIARHYMSNYDVKHSKEFTFLAIIPIVLLLIYDLITIIYYASTILDFTLFGFDFFLTEFFTLQALLMLLAINKDLKKADNPEKYKESTDWFYERLDEKDKERYNKNA